MIGGDGCSRRICVLPSRDRNYFLLVPSKQQYLPEVVCHGLVELLRKFSDVSARWQIVPSNDNNRPFFSRKMATQIFSIRFCHPLSAVDSFLSRASTRDSAFGPRLQQLVDNNEQRYCVFFAPTQNGSSLHSGL